MNNIWILTEEMPKANVIHTILKKLAKDNGFRFKIKDIIIVPIINKGRFIFVYKVNGAFFYDFENIFIKLASGNSSFVDFLVFLQKNEPTQDDAPLYAIEETKTDDSESRNTGVYQRCSKFVYVEFYYPGIKKIMLYNLQIPQKGKPTDTNIFGMRMLKTIGVEVLGKVYENEIKPFSNLDELVVAKNSMHMPPAGNVPIRIETKTNRINISGRLYKAEGIGHDPNIGALSIIALCIRKFEKTKDIFITQHGLSQEHVTNRNNKFIQIANKLNIKLDGLNLSEAASNEAYWHYENSQEKTVTIFLHVALIAYANAEVIYSNHGGSERGYFIDKTKGPIAIEKYQEGMKEAYKLGNKELIIHIPDIIVFDSDRQEVINVEGKKYATRMQGIEDLKNYSYIEKEIITPSYKPKNIIRTVVVFGSKQTNLKEGEISFMLNDNGEMILNKNAPNIFKKAIKGVLYGQSV